MGSAIWPVGASGGGNAVLSRAQTLLGATVTAMMGTEFDNDQWYRTTSFGTGAVTPSITDSGGVISLTSGATANSTASLQPHGTICLIGNPRTGIWYASLRMIVTTAIDAQATAMLDIMTQTLGNPQIQFGVVGAVSTSFFSWRLLDGAGATTVSGATTVAIDTAYHVYEMASNGTTITFYIDGASVGSTAATNAQTTSVTPNVLVQNGSTTTARTAKVDYLWVCTPPPAS